MQMNKDHYLNEEQKKVKQKIMEEIMAGLWTNIDKNSDKFDGITLADLIINCIIMLARDSFAQLFMFSNIRYDWKEALREISKVIEDAIDERMGEMMEQIKRKSSN